MLDLYKGKSQMNFTWNVHILYDFYTLSLRWLVFFHMRFFRVSFGVTFWHMIHFISHVSFTQDSSIMWFFFFGTWIHFHDSFIFTWFLHTILFFSQDTWFICFTWILTHISFHVIFTHNYFIYTWFIYFHVNFDTWII